MLKGKIKYVIFSALCVAALFALSMFYKNTPGQMNFKSCIEEAAEKARGAVVIYNSIRSIKCDRLRPIAVLRELRDDEIVIPLNSQDDKKGPIFTATTTALNDKRMYFHGYKCKADCSGHEAGYKWAERNDIDDEDDCTGRSWSFIEGCMAYVEENS